MKMVCYCADDYALNDQISEAILILLQKNAIQATSCMTQSPRWKAQAKKLVQLKESTSYPFEIGLHLNFTHPFSSLDTLHFSLSQLMVKAWTKNLDREKIKQSIAQQWHLFIEAIGVAPDFIDGHQHIHQFPMIREILLEFLNEQNFKGWLRNLNHTIPAKKYQFKSKSLQYLGAQTTYELAHKYHFAMNRYFSGIYDFNNNDYAKLMREWMGNLYDQTLVMCHPALDLPEEHDEIQNARVKEFQYLNSSQFTQDCQKFNIQLKPMGEML